MARINFKLSLVTKIMLGMIIGLLAGLLLRILPPSHFVDFYIVNGVCDVVGKIFIRLLEMLVVPIIFVSLVCGICSFGDIKQLGRIGIKVITIFAITTIIAILIALLLATLFNVGSTATVHLISKIKVIAPMSLKQNIINLIPINPIHAMNSNNLLQVIIFALLLGIAISLSGLVGEKVAKIFSDINIVLMKLVSMIMVIAPYSVFCLIIVATVNLGFGLIKNLAVYMIVIMFSLAIQLFGIYSLFLIFLAKLNPITFFRKIYPVMIFAFSTSSSNATLPINLDITERKLGVPKSICVFAIPLGATINMDGTAIVQSVAAIFIANIYHIPISFSVYLSIITTTALASIGTAGVPNIGMITLAMVLHQAGLPLSGIGLIMGVDRILDMLRTVVNVIGDSVTACIVAKSEKN